MLSDISRMGGTCRRKVSVISSRFFLVIFATASCILGQFNGVSGDRTFTKVYEPITGTAACFKRLNGTHEIGCRSSANGAVGILHMVEDSESLQWVLKDGPHAPYIVLTYPDQFNRENLMKFRNSGRVNGVLLLPLAKDDTDDSFSISKKMAPFSTDSSCPNHQFGIYNVTSPKYCPKWNAPGNSTLFDNFDFPIFFVKNDSEAKTLISCYESSNKPINGTPRDWPLCAGQLKSFMMAAKDTPTCLRRSTVFSINPSTSKVCDPLGDQNLWATLLPQNDTAVETKSALVLAARMDGASMFDEMTPSADSSVTGLVTLLAVIKHLGAVKDQIGVAPDSVINSVYFMLFNGEAFGYIGSSRIAYDMTQGKFPLKLDEIRYFLEVNQAAQSKDSSYFIHQSDLSQSSELTNLLQEQASKNNLNLTTIPKDDSSPWGVPPSSLHSFLRERPDLTGVVLTNHRDLYKNSFYNSIFDTKENVKYTYGDADNPYSIQQRIAALAATIANSVIKLLNKTSDIKFSADPETVDELLYCYLETSNCTIFRAISGFDPSPNSPMEPYPLYVGVAWNINTLTQITKYIMVSYLGDPVENATTEDVCFGRNSGADPTISHRNRFFINGTCFDCPQINMTEAKSPAFIIPNYDWSSGKYSTWTESVWQKFSVKIFLKPSLAHEILTLISGIVVVILSFAVVRFVNAKSELIFPSRTDAMVC